MRFEDSKYFKKLNHKKIVFPFGNFYLCDFFFVAELNEGVHFGWEEVQRVMPKIIDYYGSDIKLGYISNRVNSYSSDPQNWKKIDKAYGIIIASAIIYYSDFTYKNASLEKLFSQKSIKRCMSLDEAILWMKSINEFN